MKLSVRLFPSLYISLLCVSISSSVFAVQTQTPERWFEIEVILFKQLGDRTDLKEKFPDNVSAKNLPQYKKYFDLLTTYLQPSLTSISNLCRCVPRKIHRIYCLSHYHK
jgi:5-bromo-4-chloroindolyl phosphate hydrolysis protein